MELLKTIGELCMLDGTSGDEGAVAAYIQKTLSGVCETSVDALGNVIARRGEGGLTLFAHMDEVGLIVTHIGEDGLLSFESLGMDLRVLFGRRVFLGAARVPGVVGGKVWHHLSEKEHSAPIRQEDVFIDIGASTREEAAALVSPGERGVPEGEFVRLGDRVISKALDDRVSCAFLLALLTSTELPMTAVFTVREEIGLIGAGPAAFALRPRRALILEVTTAADLPDVPAARRVCEQGKGPTLSFADKRTLYDRGFYREMSELAAREGIPWQPKTGIAGGNDAGSVHPSGAGVVCATLSLPCRYLHSGSCLLLIEDIENGYRFVKAAVAAYAGEGAACR